VAVDPVKECGEIDEHVTRIDELEVKELFLARHGLTLFKDFENGSGDMGIPAYSPGKVRRTSKNACVTAC
jgi:hypothetical protein